MPARSYWLAVGWLTLCVTLVFGATFANQWTYDDFPLIVENTDIRSLVNFFADTRPGRPLRELSYMIDFKLFGLEPAGYHLQNILWHLGNGILVLTLLLRLNVQRWLAIGGASVFLLHPLQVEVVASLAHRKDSLALFFVLSALLLFLRGRQASSKKLIWFAGAFVAWSAAFFAKQHAFMLPLVLLFWGLCSCEERQDRHLRGKRTAVVAALGAGLVFVIWVTGHYLGGAEAFLHTAAGQLQRIGYFESNILEAHYLLVIKSALLIWSKVVLPVGLAVEYTPEVPAGWFDPWVVGSVVVALAGGYAVWRWRRHPLIVSGAGWALLFWLPTSNLWPLSYYAADRYMYTPMVGCVLLLVGFVQGVPRKYFERITLPVGSLLLLVFAVASWQQSSYWRTEETLWARAYQVNPDSPFAINNMGMIHVRNNELDKAYVLFRDCVERIQSNPTCHYNLGWYYEATGNPSEALRHYRNFLAFREPVFAEERKRLRQRLRMNYGVNLEGD